MPLRLPAEPAAAAPTAPIASSGARVSLRGAWLAAGLLLGLLLAAPLRAQDFPGDGPGESVMTEAYRTWCMAQYEARQKAAADKADLLVLPGLVADRAAGTVRIDAMATGHTGNTPVEFVLVGDGGKDYESLSGSIVLASDLRRAIEFIGQQPGWPVHFDTLHFWSRGDRVRLEAEWQTTAEDGVATTHRAPAEEFILDLRTDKALPSSGFTFTGSYYREVDAETRAEIAETKGVPLEQIPLQRLEADVSNDLVSLFSDRYAVLDTPYRAIQEVVYRQLVPNPALASPPKRGDRIAWVLTPMAPAGTALEIDYALTIGAPATATATTELRFDMKQIGPPAAPPSSAPVTPEAAGLQGADFDALLAFIYKELQDGGGRHVFVHPDFAPSTPLRTLPEFAKMLDALASREVTRLEPVAGALYYQAFLSKAEWLDAEERTYQPLELTVAPDGTSVDLLKYWEVYPDEGGRELKRLTYRAASPEALLAHLQSREKWETDSVFWHVPPTMTYGELMRWYTPIQAAFPQAFVYFTKPEAAPKAPEAP